MVMVKMMRVAVTMMMMMTPWHVSGPWQPGGGGGKTNNQPMIILPVNWAESICINSIYHNTVYILHHYRHIIYDMLMMASSRGGKSLKLLVSVYNVWVSCFSWLSWFQLSVGEETGA